jgi:hypothetical protein
MVADLTLISNHEVTHIELLSNTTTAAIHKQQHPTPLYDMSPHMLHIFCILFPFAAYRIRVGVILGENWRA